MTWAALQERRQRFAINEVHHHAALIVHGKRIEQPDNIRMIQAGVAVHLILKARPDIWLEKQIVRQ